MKQGTATCTQKSSIPEAMQPRERLNKKCPTSFSRNELTECTSQPIAPPKPLRKATMERLTKINPSVSKIHNIQLSTLSDWIPPKVILPSISTDRNNSTVNHETSMPDPKSLTHLHGTDFHLTKTRNAMLRTNSNLES